MLRKATGRGKNRKAGGLITLQLPDENENFESAEVLRTPPPPHHTHTHTAQLLHNNTLCLAKVTILYDARERRGSCINFGKPGGFSHPQNLTSYDIVS